MKQWAVCYVTQNSPTGKTLGSLEFLTVALIAEAAGYEIEFRRKAS